MKVSHNKIGDFLKPNKFSLNYNKFNSNCNNLFETGSFCQGNNFNNCNNVNSYLFNFNIDQFNKFGYANEEYAINDFN